MCGQVEGFAEAARAAEELHACTVDYFADDEGFVHIIGILFYNLPEIRQAERCAFGHGVRVRLQAKILCLARSGGLSLFDMTSLN